jgi:hypothetical protein
LIRTPARPTGFSSLVFPFWLRSSCCGLGLPKQRGLAAIPHAGVLHWAQAGDLDHFATPYDSETSRPHWAEVAILNLRTLWGSDRPANLPQAASLIGVAVAASGIARLLGGNRRTQILAAVTAFAVPMALLQAPTPKNDIVSSYWVMATAYFVLLESRLGLDVRDSLLPPAWRSPC